jgi:hypothetical protein
MDDVRLDSLLDLFRGPNMLLGVLWLGLTVLVVVLLVLMYTRWGSLNALRKCLALSLAAHGLLALYSTTVYVAPAVPFLRDQIIRVSLSEKPPQRRGIGRTPPGGRSASPTPSSEVKPWETFAADTGPSLAPVDPPRTAAKELPLPQRSSMAVSADLVGLPSVTQRPLVETPVSGRTSLPAEPQNPKPQVEARAEPIQAPRAQSREGARAAVGGAAQVQRLVPIDRTARSPGRMAAADVPSSLLERPLALPPLMDAAGTPQAPPTLSRFSDPALPKTSTKPAETVARASGAERGSGPNTGAAPTDSAEIAGPPGMASAAGHLKPPSLVEGEGAGGGGGSGQGGSASGLASVGPPQLPRGPLMHGDYQMPEVYRMRVAPNRSQLSERMGATPELEAAVKAGLRWVANNQERDGRWVATKHGGGKEILEAGRDRQAAGAKADTGITALAILAFAASGSTHQEGTHRQTVRHGLDFLLSIQGEDGSLGGEGQLYEFMYCHGMATLALSELAGMTGDQKLRQPLARAVAYTLAAQDPSGGGWRYRAREAGDTSQLGWQLMSLKSASLAGIAVPDRTWQGARRFLDSVSGGSNHGLASYRPGEEFTRPMTAEALACRLFLGLSRDSALSKEAGDHLLNELPGAAQPNLYYWYYGSVAMYQLQGDYWKQWSQALRNTLLSAQRTSGDLAGSWDPNTRWDGYGGRVYSTSLATLCLEAHYRFLPLNAPAKVEPPSQ